MPPDPKPEDPAIAGYLDDSVVYPAPPPLYSKILPVIIFEVPKPPFGDTVNVDDIPDVFIPPPPPPIVATLEGIRTITTPFLPAPNVRPESPPEP